MTLCYIHIVWNSYKATDNLFSEKGPVCEDGEISGAPQYSCTGKWRGKVKFGAPHVVRTPTMSAAAPL